MSQHRGPRLPGGGRAPTHVSKRRPPDDVARRIAWQLLRAVDERDAYANLALPELLAGSGLDARDRALATELGYGALRATGTLDHVLALGADRPVADIDPPLRDVLRLGAYQLLSTRIPPHAAVAATVDLARRVVGEGSGRYANAVLRKVADHVAAGGDDRAARTAAPSAESDPVGHLAVVHQHPRWVVNAFADALGSLEEAARALAADDERPETHLVARDLTRAELLDQVLAAGLEARAGDWSPYSVILSGGDPAGVPAIRSGAAGVQDEGSQLCALALARAEVLGPDTGRVLDLCAGPGGKSGLLSRLVPVVVAGEPQATRARMVRGSMRGGLVVQADGTRPPFRAGGFDRVLVDAPCSGLGALRRRPESRWRRQPADVAALAPLQKQLLTQALDLVRPGGVVAYVTCSPHLLETSVVVGDVLRKHPHVEQLDAAATLPEVPGAAAGLAVQLWPHRHGTDAMHLALLRRGTGVG